MRRLLFVCLVALPVFGQTFSVPADFVQTWEQPRLVGVYPYPRALRVRGTWSTVRQANLVLAELEVQEREAVVLAHDHGLMLTLHEGWDFEMPALGFFMVDARGNEQWSLSARGPGRVFFVFIADKRFTSTSVRWGEYPRSEPVQVSPVAPPLTFFDKAAVVAMERLQLDDTWVAVVVDLVGHLDIASVATLEGVTRQVPCHGWAVAEDEESLEDNPAVRKRVRLVYACAVTTGFKPKALRLVTGERLELHEAPLDKGLRANVVAKLRGARSL
jgi:hypothetical protein